MKGYRNGMAVRTLKLLQHIPFIKGWDVNVFGNKRETLERVDSQIAELHQQRKSTFYASLSLEFMARVLGCLEVYFILNILTTDVSFPACILIIGIYLFVCQSVLLFSHASWERVREDLPWR